MVNRMIALAVNNGIASNDYAATMYVPQLESIVRSCIQELITDPLVSGADQAVFQTQYNLSLQDSM